MQQDYRRSLIALWRAGGAGAADRLRQRGQPDDRPGGGARARDGAARLDRRGTLAAGATGAGGKRLARVPGGRLGALVRVVVRAVRRRARSIRRTIRRACSFRPTGACWGSASRWLLAVTLPLRPGAGAARFVGQAGQRAQGRRGSALAPALDARADCRAGRLLLPGALRRRTVRRHVRPPVESAHRLFRGPASHARNRHAASAAAGLLGPGGGHVCAPCPASKRSRSAGGRC